MVEMDETVHDLGQKKHLYCHAILLVQNVMRVRNWNDTVSSTYMGQILFLHPNMR